MRMMLSFLEDVIIENKQAMEMSRICLHILNENDPGMCNYHLIQSQHRDEIPGVSYDHHRRNKLQHGHRLQV